jgi:serine/threonine protein kinase
MAAMEAPRLLAGRYRLDRVLGRGGMAAVWRAHDEVLGRLVAAKLVQVGGDDPSAAVRFAREARTAAALAHPNIVTVFDAGIGSDGIAFLVMELLPGPTLSALLGERGPLPLDEGVAYAAQAAAALAAAHEAGVVHRDIKPGNLMLDAAGQVRVLDFGVARLLEAGGTTLTGTGTVLGTAAYLSPEQAAGRPADARTDIYALGCVLMALLTGTPPFAADHPMGVVTQHLSAEPPRLDERRPDVPPALAVVVAATLAKNPDDRPQTAAAVHAALLDIAHGRPGEQRPAVAAATAATQVLPTAGGGAPTARTVGRAEAQGPGWRRPAVLAAAAAAAVVLFAVTIMALTGGDDDPTTGATGGASKSATSAPTSTQPPTSAPPETTPASSPPPPPSTSQLLATLSQRVQAAAASGELDAKAAEDLGHRIDDIRKKIQEGKDDEVGRKLQEMSDRLDKLASEGKITPAAEASLQDPLVALQQQFPEQD